MEVQAVANRLVELCRNGEHEKAKQELYCNSIVSNEAPQLNLPVAKGIQAVMEKTKQWQESLVEMHSAKISEPLVVGNHFTVTMENDVTFKERGRQQLKEVCVYQVKDGKIIREDFFYN